MSNKPAPYKNQDIMATLNDWWANTYPNGTPAPYSTPDTRPIHIIELYNSYMSYVSTNPSTTPLDHSSTYISPNQFAKMLVAGKIADIGNGWWQRLPEWEPLPYQVARAKV